MGNCQAAEAATVVIQHPGNKIERIYWSVSAHEIMNSNPGHYVALVVISKSENGTPLKHLKLLRPDDTLLIGHIYRLITFEDVLKEFAAKKCVKLGKLLKERGAIGVEMKIKDLGSVSNSQNYGKTDHEDRRLESGSNSSVGGGGGGQRGGMGRHWRPALQSIAEIGI